MELKELKHLPKAWKRGTDFLGTRYAILCGAMTWVSEANLVAAISNGGASACSRRGTCPRSCWRTRDRQRPGRRRKNPFGVRPHHRRPGLQGPTSIRGNPGEVPLRLLRGEHPFRRDIAQVKAAGTKLICFAPVLSLSQAA